MKTLLPRIVAALASGAVLAIISPPLNLHWLHWFSFLPLFWALRSGEHKRNAWLGYLAGWVGVFLLFSWLIDTIVIFSNIPWVLALPIHMVFASVFALPYAVVFGSVHWFRQRLGTWWVVVVPAVQVAMEQLSPALFPYYHGVGQYRVPWVWQLASVTGVMGLSYLVFLTNTMFAEALYRAREGRKQAWGVTGAVVAVFLANLGFGAWRYGRLHAEIQRAPVLHAAILQQDVTMQQRLDESALQALAAWVKSTHRIADEGADLVVWPEGAVAFNPDGKRLLKRLGDRSPRQFFEQMAGSGDFDLLMGGGSIEMDPTDEAGRRYTAYNSAYEFTRDGALADRYDKMVPLPFGEYIPFSQTFPWLRELVQGVGDFRAGSRPTVFRGTASDGQSYTFTVPICYEAILASAMWTLFQGEDDGTPLSEKPAAHGPVDLFVNITNDAWFGNTASPRQHAMLAAAQATEFGRPMLRVAYTGISFVVEPDGDILYETEPFTDVEKVVDLHLAKVDTLYVHGGRFFGWLCALGALGAAIVGRKRTQKLPL